MRTRLESEYYPHCQLWYEVLANLHKTIEKDDPESLTSAGVAALLVTHSCFEAYLNFAGELLFEVTWAELDRLRVPAKLALIARELSVELDSSRRPLQTVMELNNWRNEEVHARIERYTEVTELGVGPSDIQIQNLESKMFEKVTAEFVDRARVDVEKLCDTLQVEAHRQHPGKFPVPDAFGDVMGTAGGTILPDEPGTQGG